MGSLDLRRQALFTHEREEYCRTAEGRAAMVINLFGGVRVRPGMEDREARLSAKLLEIVRTMPGFISYKTYTAEDGEELGIIRFDSRESLDAWAHEGEHLAAQAVAPEIYESFWNQDAETYREYTWKDGVHTDEDLTRVFVETAQAS